MPDFFVTPAAVEDLMALRTAEGGIAADAGVLASPIRSRIQSKTFSVTCSTGWSNKYGRTGTMARPVTVGPHVRTRTLVLLTNAFLACFTAVWIVNAGKAL